MNVLSCLFSHVNFPSSDIDPSNKPFYGYDFNVVTVFDEEPSNPYSYQISFKSTSIPVTSGAGLAKYLKPGIRVARGPDWKWGDQVGSFGASQCDSTM